MFINQLIQLTLVMGLEGGASSLFASLALPPAGVTRYLFIPPPMLSEISKK